MMLVRLIVDGDKSKDIVLDKETAKLVSEFLERLGHKVQWSEK
jgi:hypothetical protein